MRLLPIDEAAALLSLTHGRLYDLARQGIVPCVRLGRAIRFDEEKLREFVAAGGKALPGGWRRASKDEYAPDRAARR